VVTLWTLPAAMWQFARDYGKNTPHKATRLISIQYLRAIAAIMVFMVHVSGQLRRLGYVGPWPDWMTAGVDIFFVISGFVMWLTTRERPQSTFVFYCNRVIRIVPLYWILTGFVMITMLIFPSVVLSGRIDSYHLIASYLFLPSTDPISGLLQPVLQPGWTLNYEMYFYAIFGAFLFLPDYLLLLTVTIWLIASVYLGAVGPADNLLIRFYGSDIVLDFDFGVLLGAAFMRGWILPSPLAWMALGLGMGMLAFPGLIDAPHWFVIGIPALAIVAGAVALERRHNFQRIGLLLLLGDASYSLYLSHGIVLSACVQITRKLGFTNGWFVTPMFFVVSCLLAGIVAIMVHLRIEKPLSRLGGGLTVHRPYRV
jgi:exopolysaccharide production protein ExoZ